MLQVQRQRLQRPGGQQGAFAVVFQEVIERQIAGAGQDGGPDAAGADFLCRQPAQFAGVHRVSAGIGQFLQIGDGAGDFGQIRAAQAGDRQPGAQMAGGRIGRHAAIAHDLLRALVAAVVLFGGDHRDG